MIKSSDYRQLIYDKYATCFQDQDAGQVFNTPAADKWGRAYDYYLRNWLPESKDANILDIACGRGLFLHFLKTRGYVNITGIDISSEQISLAKQVTGNVIEGNVLEFLATTKEKYDLIIGLDIIEHFTKNEVICFLDACFNALNQNGRVILQTPNAENPFATGVFYGDFTHETLFTPLSLEGILRLSGFCDIEFRRTGPVIHGLFSFMRFIAWQFVVSLLKFCNIAETAHTGDRIFTRVFLASAMKK